MRYYRLLNEPFKAQRWVETKFDQSKRQINLYNDDFTFYGIGLY